jgi:hypothetical protein
METPDPITDAQADPDDQVEAEADLEADVEAEAESILTLDDLLPISKYQLTLGEWDRPPSTRVQFALDMLVIAAAERVARILRGDLS